MLGSLTPAEQAQLKQTIEMFEVITQSDPTDHASLEILKEAYLKLGMEKEVIQTSKRIAQAYVLGGQLSSAILEYETILQRYPDDQDALAAMQQIESKANNLSGMPPPMEMEPSPKRSSGGTTSFSKKDDSQSAHPEVEDGRQAMYKIFVESKLITQSDFDLCWPVPSLTSPPGKTIEPFIGNLTDKQIMPIENSLKLLVERSRLAYVALERYDLDVDLARSFSKDSIQRWCVLPFDRMSKSVMVATANPFNKQAVAELEQSSKNRLLWYLASPAELVRLIKKTYR